MYFSLNPGIKHCWCFRGQVTIKIWDVWCSDGQEISPKNELNMANLIHREWPLQNILNENMAKIMAWNSFKTSDVSVVTCFTKESILDHLTPPKRRCLATCCKITGGWTPNSETKKTTEVATPSALAFWSLGEEENIFFFSIPRSQKKKWSIFFVHHQLKSNPMTKIMWKDTLNILIPFHRSNCLKETCPRHLSTSGTLAAWMAAVASIQEVFTKEK